MALTDMAIRKALPREKPYMIRDDQGLYIEIKPSGKKFWRVRKWVNGKEKKRSLGEYPKITLANARNLRDIEKGITQDISPLTFESLAQEWVAVKVTPCYTPKHVQKVTSRIATFLTPYIGMRETRSITAPEILTILRLIEGAGKLETAHRVLQVIGQIMRYGVATGRADRDISTDLKGALVPQKPEHYPTITDPKEIGGLLRSIDGMSSVIVKHALKMSIYTFVRPGELRHAEWTELDLIRAEWKIPANKMKMRRPHIVPLAKQAIETLKTLKVFTGRGPYVFPSIRTSERPMSENTTNAALRRLGYDRKELTAHGFRSMASTILNENGWPPDAIERQLAHVEKSSVRAAYNHAEYLDTRREMMQWWADWLEEQKNNI